MSPWTKTLLACRCAWSWIGPGPLVCTGVRSAGKSGSRATSVGCGAVLGRALTDCPIDATAPAPVPDSVDLPLNPSATTPPSTTSQPATRIGWTRRGPWTLAAEKSAASGSRPFASRPLPSRPASVLTSRCPGDELADRPEGLACLPVGGDRDPQPL